MDGSTQTTDGTNWGEHPSYLSAREAADAIGICTRSMLGWLRAGLHGFDQAHKLPGRTGKWRIPRECVESFIANSTKGRTTDEQPTEEGV